MQTTAPSESADAAVVPDIFLHRSRRRRQPPPQPPDHITAAAMPALSPALPPAGLGQGPAGRADQQGPGARLHRHDAARQAGRRLLRDTLCSAPGRRSSLSPACSQGSMARYTQKPHPSIFDLHTYCDKSSIETNRSKQYIQHKRSSFMANYQSKLNCTLEVACRTRLHRIKLSSRTERRWNRLEKGTWWRFFAVKDV